MFAFGNGGPLNLPVIMKNATAFWGFDDANLGTTIFDSTGRGNNLVRHMLPAASTLTFAIGANEAGTQLTTGSQAKWGIWHRALTSGEITALATGIGWPFTGGNSSLSDAAAYYLLNEASSSTTYADATGRGNTLTTAGTGNTTQVAGPLGSDFATQFAGTNWLQSAATADLAPGNTTHTIVGWVKLASLVVNPEQVFWGQFNNGTRTGDVVYYNHAFGRMNWGFGNDTDLYRNALTICNNFGAISTGTWYFIVCTYDQVANTMTHSVNGTANVLSGVQQPTPGTGLIVPGNSATFTPNIDANGTATSGWDVVGSASFASIAANADVGIGNNAKTVWFWVKMADHTTTQTLCGLYNVGGNVYDWVFQIAAGVLYLSTGNSAGQNSTTVTANITDANWHLVVAWFDKTGDGKVHMNVDHGAQVSTSATPSHVPATGSNPLMLGAALHTGTASGFDQQMNGQFDGFGIANGIPTSADLDALWNNGNGRNL